jgi:hypothetical protein
MKESRASERPTARTVKTGQRMIEVKLYFWTNGIVKGKGRILPKHAWGSGVVRLDRNEAHGIEPHNPIPFHSPLELPAVIEKALIQHGVMLHPSRRMKKYQST